MRIEIYADFVCPWCYVGIGRLRRALATRPGLAANLAWRPFQLNPTMPKGGIDRGTYLSIKFGSRERLRHLHDAVEDCGRELGLAFNFDRIQRQPNTLDAHRLVRLAGERLGAASPKVEALVIALYQGYFNAGLDLGDREVLVALGVAAGLDGMEVARYLASDREQDQIRAEDLRARRMGIDGVPCFVIDEHYAISGAQEPEAFLPLFDLASA
ncbi:MAG: DsbA family oxidoreductase [Alphaproteobacteria bacterium]|nr:DsbA family oxidoreductase [Alphaproteobacteria bacterium]